MRSRRFEKASAIPGMLLLVMSKSNHGAIRVISQRQRATPSCSSHSSKASITMTVRVEADTALVDLSGADMTRSNCDARSMLTNTSGSRGSSSSAFRNDGCVLEKAKAGAQMSRTGFRRASSSLLQKNDPESLLPSLWHDDAATALFPHPATP